MGNIGKPLKKVELEPLSEPGVIEEPLAAPAVPEPAAVPEPEKVPA